MTGTRGFALFLTVAAAGALLHASSAGPGSTSTGNVRLKAISARATAGGSALVIEASEPVGYIANRPDPFTVVLEFRHATAAGITNSVAAGRGVIAGVSVEAVDSLGTPATRVRVVLAQSVAHRVRSDRNTVVVEFDKPSASSASALSRGRGPDPMSALQADAPVDLIAALGANAISGGPSAVGFLAQAQAQAPAAPPPPGPVVTQGSTTTGDRKYIGFPVSFDFSGADVRAVLRTFAEIIALNMVIDPKVAGTVDVALKDVPWDQALDIILRGNGLDFRVDGTIVRIAPRDAFTAEDKSRIDAAEAQSAAQQLTTMSRPLSYAKGEDIVKLLKDTKTISKYGQAQVDVRTNMLIVTDLASQIAQVQSLVSTLDTPQPQVEIEARIVNTNRDYAKALGVQWGFNGKVDPALGNTTNLTFPNNGSLGGRTGGQVGVANSPGGTQPTAVNLPVVGATSGVGLAMGSINGALNLDVALTALESSGKGRILSSPRVTTQNNVEAEIAQGVRIPVQTTSNQTTTTTYVDAALTLRVTPQITAAGTVILKIGVDNGSVGASTPDGKLAINTQRANTTLLLGDGQTTVIGGIFSSTNTASSDRTPGLGSVPLLNWLFKRESISEKNTELLIFITPRIIRG